MSGLQIRDTKTRSSSSSLSSPLHPPAVRTLHLLCSINLVRLPPVLYVSTYLHLSLTIWKRHARMSRGPLGVMAGGGGGGDGYHIHQSSWPWRECVRHRSKSLNFAWPSVKLFSNSSTVACSYCYCPSIACQLIHRHHRSTITWPESAEEEGDVLHARSSISKHLTLYSWRG